MAYIAVSYLALVGALMALISAQTMNTSSPTMPISSTFNTNDSTMTVTMSTMMDTVNVTDSNYTDFRSTEGQHSTSNKLAVVTPPPPAPPIKTTPKSRLLDTTTTPLPSSGGGDSVGVIIIVVIIVIVLLAALICFVARNKGRRYSVDLSSRPDDVQIPLSTVEPNPTVETFLPNGLQFEGTEGSAQELQETQETHEPEVKLEDQVEQKAEPEKVTADASADCAAPPAETPEDQTMQDVPEQSPAAPVEPSGGEEKTDDEGAASNKTSVEMPKENNEANENNSNSTVQPQRGARDGEAFWDTSLDSMV